MKKLSLLISLILIFISIFAVPASAFTTVVDDRADLFDENENFEIVDSVTRFTNETGYTAAVVTTDDAEGKTSGKYADDYYDININGDGSYPDGILFLIDMDNREVYISTSGECIEVYTDSKIDFIIDCGYDELLIENYAECIILMIEKASELKDQVFADDYNFGEDGYYDDEYYYDDGSYGDATVDFNYNMPSYSGSHVLVNIAKSFVFALVVALIAVLIVKNQYKNTGKGDEFDADDVALNLTDSNDTVISKNVVTARIPKNNNNSNHRSGGGSSVHRSSGGARHGGGGRKF